MIAAQGILTSAGGTNSHAAVVARGEGIPAVCGADAIKLRVAEGRSPRTAPPCAKATTITIDGFTGNVFVGELPMQGSLLEKGRQGDVAAREQPLWRAFDRLMTIADARRRLRVRANADTPDQSTNARSRGAEGIGLCRTEHMFLGEERVLAVRTMIFAETAEEEQEAYDALLPLQRDDFVGIFTAMSGLPVTVRLLDPPLHEFLPDQVELAVEVALGKARGRGRRRAEGVLQKVNELHEMNPMLGLRGVRLGIVKPGLYAMQVRAIVEAAVAGPARRRRSEGRDHDPAGRHRAGAAADARRAGAGGARVLDREGVELSHLEWGTMIELPRAAVTAGEIARDGRVLLVRHQRPHADRVRVQPRRHRQVRGHVRGAQAGARQSVRHDRPAGRRRADAHGGGRGRAANPTSHLGICGEHGGDPASVVFCHELGLDYVSCSPFRVETARLAAGQAAVGEAESASK